jgi:GT2 family glycosyltransferase
VISIVIAARNARAMVGTCLSGFDAQRDAPPFEVIVVDSGDDGTPAQIAETHPRVRVLTSPARLWPGDARNLGAREAHGEILVFTDADCVPAPDFVAAIDRAHAPGDSAIIGGAIENGDPASAVETAYFFSTLSAWMAGTPRRPMIEVAGGCLSVTRAAFDRFGPFLARTYSSDTAFCWKAARAGETPIFDPSIVIRHTSGERLGHFLRGRMHRGRVFARMRVREGQWRLGRRVLWIAASPLIAVVLFTRIVRRVLAAPGRLGAFAGVSPLVALAIAAWTVGEALGYADRTSRVST